MSVSNAQEERNMTRTHIIGATMIAIALALILPTAALAQVEHRTFQDSMGRTTGRSVTNSKGNTTFYDAQGRNTGRSVTSNSGTTFFDRMGRTTGSVTTKPQGK